MPLPRVSGHRAVVAGRKASGPFISASPSAGNGDNVPASDRTCLLRRLCRLLVPHWFNRAGRGRNRFLRVVFTFINNGLILPLVILRHFFVFELFQLVPLFGVLIQLIQKTCQLLVLQLCPRRSDYVTNCGPLLSAVSSIVNMGPCSAEQVSGQVKLNVGASLHRSGNTGGDKVFTPFSLKLMKTQEILQKGALFEPCGNCCFSKCCTCLKCSDTGLLASVHSHDHQCPINVNKYDRSQTLWDWLQWVWNPYSQQEAGVPAAKVSSSNKGILPLAVLLHKDAFSLSTVFPSMDSEELWASWGSSSGLSVPGACLGLHALLSNGLVNQNNGTNQVLSWLSARILNGCVWEYQVVGEVSQRLKECCEVHLSAEMCPRKISTCRENPTICASKGSKSVQNWIEKDGVCRFAHSGDGIIGCLYDTSGRWCPFCSSNLAFDLNLPPSHALLSFGPSGSHAFFYVEPNERCTCLGGSLAGTTRDDSTGVGGSSKSRGRGFGSANGKGDMALLQAVQALLPVHMHAAHCILGFESPEAAIRRPELISDAYLKLLVLLGLAATTTLEGNSELAATGNNSTKCGLGPILKDWDFFYAFDELSAYTAHGPAVSTKTRETGLSSKAKEGAKKGDIPSTSDFQLLLAVLHAARVTLLMQILRRRRLVLQEANRVDGPMLDFGNEGMKGGGFQRCLKKSMEKQALRHRRQVQALDESDVVTASKSTLSSKKNVYSLSIEQREQHCVKLLQQFADELLTSVWKAEHILSLYRQQKAILSSSQYTFLQRTVDAFGKWATTFGELDKSTACVEDWITRHTPSGLSPGWEFELSPHPLAVAMRKQHLLLLRLLLSGGLRAVARGTGLYRNVQLYASASNLDAACAGSNSSKDGSYFVVSAIAELVIGSPESFSLQTDLGGGSCLFHFAAYFGCLEGCEMLRNELFPHCWWKIFLAKDERGLTPVDISLQRHETAGAETCSLMSWLKDAEEIGAYQIYTKQRTINGLLTFKLLLFSCIAAWTPLSLLHISAVGMTLLLSRQEWAVRFLLLTLLFVSEVAGRQLGYDERALVRSGAIFGGLMLSIAHLSTDVSYEHITTWNASTNFFKFSFLLFIIWRMSYFDNNGSGMTKLATVLFGGLLSGRQIYCALFFFQLLLRIQYTGLSLWLRFVDILSRNSVTRTIKERMCSFILVKERVLAWINEDGSDGGSIKGSTWRDSYINCMRWCLHHTDIAYLIKVATYGIFFSSLVSVLLVGSWKWSTKVLSPAYEILEAFSEIMYLPLQNGTKTGENALLRNNRGDGQFDESGSFSDPGEQRDPILTNLWDINKGIHGSVARPSIGDDGISSVFDYGAPSLQYCDSSGLMDRAILRRSLFTAPEAMIIHRTADEQLRLTSPALRRYIGLEKVGRRNGDTNDGADNSFAPNKVSWEKVDEFYSILSTDNLHGSDWAGDMPKGSTISHSYGSPQLRKVDSIGVAGSCSRWLGKQMSSVLSSRGDLTNLPSPSDKATYHKYMSSAIVMKAYKLDSADPLDAPDYDFGLRELRACLNQKGACAEKEPKKGLLEVLSRAESAEADVLSEVNDLVAVALEERVRFKRQMRVSADSNLDASGRQQRKFVGFDKGKLGGSIPECLLDPKKDSVLSVAKLGMCIKFLEDEVRSRLSLHSADTSSFYAAFRESLTDLLQTSLRRNDNLDTQLTEAALEESFSKKLAPFLCLECTSFDNFTGRCIHSDEEIQRVRKTRAMQCLRRVRMHLLFSETLSSNSTARATNANEDELEDINTCEPAGQTQGGSPTLRPVIDFANSCNAFHISPQRTRRASSAEEIGTARTVLRPKAMPGYGVGSEDFGGLNQVLKNLCSFNEERTVGRGDIRRGVWGTRMIGKQTCPSCQRQLLVLQQIRSELLCYHQMHKFMSNTHKDRLRRKADDYGAAIEAAGEHLLVKKGAVLLRSHQLLHLLRSPVHLNSHYLQHTLFHENPAQQPPRQTDEGESYQGSHADGRKQQQQKGQRLKDLHELTEFRWRIVLGIIALVVSSVCVVTFYRRWAEHCADWYSRQLQQEEAHATTVDSKRNINKGRMVLKKTQHLNRKQQQEQAHQGSGMPTDKPKASSGIVNVKSMQGETPPPQIVCNKKRTPEGTQKTQSDEVLVNVMERDPREFAVAVGSALVDTANDNEFCMVEKRMMCKGELEVVYEDPKKENLESTSSEEVNERDSVLIAGGGKVAEKSYSVVLNAQPTTFCPDYTLPSTVVDLEASDIVDGKEIDKRERESHVSKSQEDPYGKQSHIRGSAEPPKSERKERQQMQETAKTEKNESRKDLTIAVDPAADVGPEKFDDAYNGEQICQNESLNKIVGDDASEGLTVKGSSARGSLSTTSSGRTPEDGHDVGKAVLSTPEHVVKQKLHDDVKVVATRDKLQETRRNWGLSPPVSSKSRSGSNSMNSGGIVNSGKSKGINSSIQSLDADFTPLSIASVSAELPRQSVFRGSTCQKRGRRDGHDGLWLPVTRGLDSTGAVVVGGGVKGGSRGASAPTVSEESNSGHNLDDDISQLDQRKRHQEKVAEARPAGSAISAMVGMQPYSLEEEVDYLAKIVASLESKKTSFNLHRAELPEWSKDVLDAGTLENLQARHGWRIVRRNIGGHHYSVLKIPRKVVAEFRYRQAYAPAKNIQDTGARKTAKFGLHSDGATVQQASPCKWGVYAGIQKRPIAQQTLSSTKGQLDAYEDKGLSDIIGMQQISNQRRAISRPQHFDGASDLQVADNSKLHRQTSDVAADESLISNAGEQSALFRSGRPRTQVDTEATLALGDDGDSNGPSTRNRSVAHSSSSILGFEDAGGTEESKSIAQGLDGAVARQAFGDDLLHFLARRTNGTGFFDKMDGSNANSSSSSDQASSMSQPNSVDPHQAFALPPHELLAAALLSAEGSSSTQPGWRPFARVSSTHTFESGEILGNSNNGANMEEGRSWMQGFGGASALAVSGGRCREDVCGGVLDTNDDKVSRVYRSNDWGVSGEISRLEGRGNNAQLIDLLAEAETSHPARTFAAAPGWQLPGKSNTGSWQQQCGKGLNNARIDCPDGGESSAPASAFQWGALDELFALRSELAFGINSSQTMQLHGSEDSLGKAPVPLAFRIDKKSEISDSINLQPGPPGLTRTIAVNEGVAGLVENEMNRNITSLWGGAATDEIFRTNTYSSGSRTLRDFRHSGVEFCDDIEMMASLRENSLPDCNKCLICSGPARDCLLQPCGHCGLCSSCAAVICCRSNPRRETLPVGSLRGKLLCALCLTEVTHVMFL